MSLMTLRRCWSTFCGRFLPHAVFIRASLPWFKVSSNSRLDRIFCTRRRRGGGQVKTSYTLSVQPRIRGRSTRDAGHSAFAVCGKRASPILTHRRTILRLVIMNEILGDVGAPRVEGIIRQVVARGPVAGHRDVVDVGGIFAEAAPRILHIVEVVRAEHMAAPAPTFGKAFFQHVHGAGADFVDRAHVPTEMMVAGSVRAGKRDHVMIAAVNAMQEGDVVAG